MKNWWDGVSAGKVIDTFLIAPHFDFLKRKQTLRPIKELDFYHVIYIDGIVMCNLFTASNGERIFMSS